MPCDFTFLLNDFLPFSGTGFHDSRGVQSVEVLRSSQALVLDMGEGILFCRYFRILN